MNMRTTNFTAKSVPKGPENNTPITSTMNQSTEMQIIKQYRFVHVKGYVKEPHKMSYDIIKAIDDLSH